MVSFNNNLMSTLSDVRVYVLVLYKEYYSNLLINAKRSLSLKFAGSICLPQV